MTPRVIDGDGHVMEALEVTVSGKLLGALPIPCGFVPMRLGGWIQFLAQRDQLLAVVFLEEALPSPLGLVVSEIEDLESGRL